MQKLAYNGEQGLELELTGTVRTGKNSGHQALNAAVQRGAARILLLGFDMQGGHWHGDHPSGLANPTDLMLETWRRNMATTVPDLRRAGVEVVNCSRETALTCFPRARLKDVL